MEYKNIEDNDEKIIETKETTTEYMKKGNEFSQKKIMIMQ